MEMKHIRVEGLRVPRRTCRGVGRLVLCAGVVGLLALSLTSCPGPAPAGGEYVDVGGYNLFYRIAGEGAEGTPTVVLMSGLNDKLTVWNKVQSMLTDVTTVSYDRGGVGWSDEGANPRSGGVIVGELHNFLQASGFQPPYVLCAHSFAGLFARLYAYTYPTEVVGIVLIDTTHEDRFDRQALVLPPRSAEMIEIQEVVVEAFMGGVGALGEWMNRNNTFAEVRSKRTLADIPLTLLSEDFSEFNYLAADDANKTYELERELDEDQAALVPRGAWQTVPGAGHDIQKQRPDVVIDAIHSVIAQATGA